VAHEDLSLRRKPDFTVKSVEKLDTGILLKLSNMLAHSRLTYIQSLGSLSEASFRSDRHKNSQSEIL
jgi:hypothetical protein